MEGRFEILVYHRIAQENSLDGLTISENNFVKQMRHIQRQCQPMGLKELVLSVLQRKPIPARAVAVTFDDGYADTFKIAFPILERMEIPATIFITTGFINGEAPSYQNAPMLSWNRIKKMQRAGIEIGAHTLTHPHLTQCSLREVKRQMIGSKRQLEDKLKNPVSLFAYPYGGTRSFNKAIEVCAREAGFLAACTTIPGSNGPDTDLYALRRNAPLRDELHHLMFQLDQAATSLSRHAARGGGQPRSRQVAGRRSSRPDKSVHGISQRAIQLWTSCYKKARRRLSQKSPFYWRMDRLSGY